MTARVFLATTRGLAIVTSVLFALGLAGHLAAARVEGGRPIHYRHHIVGFLVLSLASGIIALALEGRFWKGRRDFTLLGVGLLQAAFGWAIYVLFSRQMM